MEGPGEGEWAMLRTSESEMNSMVFSASGFQPRRKVRSLLRRGKQAEWAGRLEDPVKCGMVWAFGRYAVGERGYFLGPVKLRRREHEGVERLTT